MRFIIDLIAAYKYIKSARERRAYDQKRRLDRSDLYLEAYDKFIERYPKTSYSAEDEAFDHGWINGYMHLATDQNFISEIIKKDQLARMGALLELPPMVSKADYDEACRQRDVYGSLLTTYKQKYPEICAPGDRLVPDDADIEKATMAAHNPEMYMEKYGSKNV